MRDTDLRGKRTRIWGYSNFIGHELEDTDLRRGHGSEAVHGFESYIYVCVCKLKVRSHDTIFYAISHPIFLFDTLSTKIVSCDNISRTENSLQTRLESDENRIVEIWAVLI